MTTSVSPTFISLFSGVGGFELGLERAGYRCVGQVEIDPNCIAVLNKHWPEVPKHHDIRSAVDWWFSEPRERPDVVTLGFPCQDVSVAGLRAGLDGGSRTNLFYDALAFIAAVGPRLVCLENVPGLLTSNKGRDFGVVVDSLVQVGYPHVEWRVLDSRYFGVPQRRRRIFIVASVGDPHGGAFLFEREVGGGDPGPRATPGESTTALVAPGVGVGGG